MDGYKIYFHYDSSFLRLSEANQKFVKETLIPYAHKFYNLVILKTLTTRNYDFGQFSGMKALNFIIPSNLPKGYDLYISIGAEDIGGGSDSSTLAYAV